VKKSLVIGAAVLACGASAGVVTAVASGQHGAVDPGKVASASPTTPAIILGQGWQGDFVYSVPTGVGGVFFHYPCPNGLTPDGGKFDVDFSDPAANTVHLIGEGIRTDVASHEWQWKINWFGGGAPAGSHITFNVHCSKK
jgi:hypothetical protein